MTGGADVAGDSDGESTQRRLAADVHTVVDAKASGGSEETPLRQGWRHRRTVRTLRREAAANRSWFYARDQSENEETCPPAGETVHVGGVVLAEAFTPSTVSALYRALEDLPSQRPDRKEEWIAHLKRSRSALKAGGWLDLGFLRHPGAFVFGDLDNDPTLPDSVDAVWLRVFCPVPSLTVVVATFTFMEEAGDLSGLLRAQYRSEKSEICLHVSGRFGGVREKIPWSRPASYSLWHGVRRVEDQKRIACESLISRHETACWNWFSERFTGRFSAESISNRPGVRLLFTKDHPPFNGRIAWLRPVGIVSSIDMWRSTDVPGWAIGFREMYRERQHMAIAAARREDAADEPTSGRDKDGVWYLTQQFHDRQSPLIARWVISCLMSIYADRLGGLRDRAGIRRRVSRPVRQARDLDKYLIGDGLDASTVASDIDDFTKDVTRFRWEVPEYVEDLSGYSEEYRARRQPMELVPVLADSLRTQAERLLKDMAVTSASISASAELRQAIANTRLQRTVLVLTIIATAIAVISLLSRSLS